MELLFQSLDGANYAVSGTMIVGLWGIVIGPLIFKARWVCAELWNPEILDLFVNVCDL